MKLDDRQSPWRKRLDRYVGIPLVIFVALFRLPIKFIFSLFLRSKSTQRPRILVIKLSALGDALLMMPALYRVRATYPEAELVFLGGSSNQEFLKLTGAIDRVETFSAKTCLKLVKDSYDLVIDFDQWVRATALLSALCVARQTSGFKTPGHHRHFAYDLAFPFNLREHMARNFWNLAKASLEKANHKITSTFENDCEEARVQWAGDLKKRVIGEMISQPYYVIHPGCGENGTKREWPVESWLALIRSIQMSQPDLLFIVTGRGAHEKEWGEILAKQSGVTSQVDRLTLPQLIVTLSHARRIIASNTGVMHLADYVNDFVLVLEGPTKSALWGTLWRGKNKESPLACAPCLTWGHDYGCSDPVCLKAITPKEVFEAL